jgi:hypothetical protein
VDKQEILRKLNELLGSLETDYAISEAKGWKLMMVIFGNEVEALRRARDLLAPPSPLSTSDGRSQSGTQNGFFDMDNEQPQSSAAVDSAHYLNQRAKQPLHWSSAHPEMIPRSSNFDHETEHTDTDDDTGDPPADLFHSEVEPVGEPVKRTASIDSSASLRDTLAQFGMDVHNSHQNSGGPAPEGVVVNGHGVGGDSDSFGAGKDKGKAPASRVDESDEDDGPSADLLISRD